MNKYIHFHTYSRVIAILIILIAGSFILQKSNISIARNPDPNEVEIGGWAWNESVGWISLNCKNDFDGDGLLEDTCGSYSYGLEVSPVGNVVGCAWGGTSRNANVSNTIGYICFSDPGTTEAPNFGTYILNETGHCISDTTCVDSSDCNVAGDDRWSCLGGVCHVECTAENEAAVCGVGKTCDLTDGSNYLCPGNYGSGHLWSCVLPTSTISAVPSIVDLEIYGGAENSLYLPRDQIVSATTGYAYGSIGFDLDNPQFYWGGSGDGGYYQYDNPLNGCFNCHQDNVGSCHYRGSGSSWDCIEGDGLCEALPDLADTCEGDPGFCDKRGTSCEDDADCPDIATGDDYCEITDIEYNCENCLEYFYYDQENATTSRSDQCQYSQAACEYIDTTYASGYKYRRILEIGNDSTRTEDLVNFPFLFNQEFEFLKHTSKGGDVDNLNGYDIVFTTSTDGSNPLAHELEYYNHRNGKITAWISIPVLSGSANTIIYIFYGNSSINTDTSDTASIWSEYAFVSHMNDVTAAEVAESVSSTLTGIKADFNSPTMTNFDQFLGQGQYFDGVNDYIDFGDVVNVNLPVTMSVWSNIPIADTGQEPYNFITTDDVASTSAGTAKTGFWLRVYDQLEVGFGDGTSILTKSSDPLLDPGEDYFVGVIGSTNSADMKLYKDGKLYIDSTTTVSGTAIAYSHNTSTLRIGRREGFGTTTADYVTTGYIDEVRIATVVRSADWISAEYSNQNTSGWVEIGCQQRYSSSTNGDQFCDFTNPDYPDLGYWPIGDVSCDVCEKHDTDTLFKVLGGYNCTLCTIEDNDNSCELNALGANRNRCEYCASVYKTPGLLYDNKYNAIEASTTSACDPNQDDPSEGNFCQRGSLCGWGINTWREDDIVNFGLGWFQFSPRITSSSRPYFSVENGSIYSKGNIYSRYSPPFGKYNATYLIESGGQITNIISSSTISNTFEGELSNRPTLDFFEILVSGDSKKYKSSLGLIDFTGIVTDPDDGSSFIHDTAIGGSGNKYGSHIDYVANLSTEFVGTFLLGGKTYTTNNDTTLDNSTSTVINIDIVNSSGIIVIDGDLSIDRNIYYEDAKYSGSENKITNTKLIPSLVWIVRGDVNIGGTVDEIAGTFVILGAEDTPCESITSTSCGTFNTGSGASQLIVNGSVLARQFILDRTYSDSDGNPSEKFINTGRLQANPPMGLEDLKKLTPRYSF